MSTASLHTIVSQFLSPVCADTFLNDFNFFDAACLKLTISKVLGLLVVLGAVFVKLPQVINIVKAGSSRGLSLTSVVLELAAYLITVTYNVALAFPFSTWGEALFLSVWNIIIIFCIFHFNKQTVIGVGAVAVSLGFAYGGQHLDVETLKILQSSTMLLTLASKLPQIYQNFVNKSTGVLSAITVFLNLAGTVARIFTTIQEVDDQIILAIFLLSTFLNAVLAVQMVLYWKSSTQQVQKTKTKKTQ